VAHSIHENIDYDVEPLVINPYRKVQGKSSQPKDYQTDRNLAAACVQGDRQAQRSLFERYKDALYTLLCRMLIDEDEASDALQETFIRAFKGISSYQAKSSLWSWLRTIAVRAAINRQKRRKFHTSLEDVHTEVEHYSIRWDDNLTGEYLEKAVNQLADGYRNVFVLIEIEGYTHKEVGKMLGISPGTSKSQLYHAKRLLQKQLKELYQE